MAMTGLIEGDFGAVIEVTVREGGVAVDISGYTTRTYKFLSPAGVTKSKTAAFKVSGADGVLTYALANGDIDEPGEWKLQVYLAAATRQVSSAPVTFEVGRRLA